jgi:hypothetical protein
MLCENLTSEDTAVIIFHALMTEKLKNPWKEASVIREHRANCLLPAQFVSEKNFGLKSYFKITLQRNVNYCIP